MPLSKAAKAQSPDARPTVRVEDAPEVPSRPYRLYNVVCHTGDCTYTYGPALKTDAQQHAKWHRDQHRRRAAQT